MPANFQRLMPFFLIAIVLLFILPQVLKKKSSGPSAKTKATQTIDATNLIDAGEQAYQTAHSRYTTHLADLLALKPGLATDLAIGLAVQLDVGTDGQSYVAQVASTNLSLVRARNGTKVTARSCLVLKKASGVACPTTA